VDQAAQILETMRDLRSDMKTVDAKLDDVRAEIATMNARLVQIDTKQGASDKQLERLESENRQLAAQLRAVEKSLAWWAGLAVAVSAFLSLILPRLFGAVKL
jgi:septal ring factor EnvC (AmiA/AmiB activator)